MTTLVVDSHSLVTKLKTKGFSAEQAEGVVEALRELDISELATKTDLKDLRLDLYRYMFGIAVGQTALIVGLLQFLQ